METLTVRISHNTVGGYDWYDKTEEDLLENYCIYAYMLISKEYAKTLLPKGAELTWMNGVDSATPAELYNYCMINYEDKKLVSYCKAQYEIKYGRS